MEFFLGVFSADWEQRKAALLYDLSLGRKASSEEDDRRRRGGSVAASRIRGGSTSRQSGGGAGKLLGRGERHADRPADRPMRARFKGLASGGQPAVVKMASFGGGARLGAMVNYLSRNGAIAVENERGERLLGRDQLSTHGSQWDHLMSNRAESRDIGLFKIAVTETIPQAADLTEHAGRIVSQALGDRSFVYAVSQHQDGHGFDIAGVAVLRDRNGERLTADDKAAGIVQARLDREVGEGRQSSFSFSGYGNGTDYGTARVRALVEAHAGQVSDEQGRTIADARHAGDLVQLEWRGELHSRKPRDVMHLIVSARAGTDVHAFQDAARDFLATQFAGHRYVFSLHDAENDPKAEGAGGRRPHVHIHAVVAMRSDAGDRIETTIPAFRQWRLTMAEKARSHGIDMEMTDRRDRSSPAAYTKNQVRPLNMIGRTEHEGTSEAAHQRYGAKRRDEPTVPTTDRGQRYALDAAQTWRELSERSHSAQAIDFAARQEKRTAAQDAEVAETIPDASAVAKSVSQSRTYMVKLAELVFEGDDMRHMDRKEFETYEKRVETALFQAERAIAVEERQSFDEIVKAAREHVAARRELMELSEERSKQALASGQDAPQAGSREDERQRFDDAVVRHGLADTMAANNALVDIERTRADIALANNREKDAGQTMALKADLERNLLTAAELGAGGNGLIRQVAEFDAELKLALEAVERERQRDNSDRRLRTDSPDRRSAEAHHASAETSAEVDDRKSGRPDPETHRDAARASSRGGDAGRDDPANQHVPRLNVLQQDVEAQRERDDRDDR